MMRALVEICDPSKMRQDRLRFELPSCLATSGYVQVQSEVIRTEPGNFNSSLPRDRRTCMQRVRHECQNGSRNIVPEVHRPFKRRCSSRPNL
jgi:hypothetical protein